MCVMHPVRVHACARVLVCVCVRVLLVSGAEWEEQSRALRLSGSACFAQPACGQPVLLWAQMACDHWQAMLVHCILGQTHIWQLQC